MHILKLLRIQAGLTQQELADLAGTSQSTIAAYESGTKSPTWRTVQKLARAAGAEANATFVPPLTREDRRSLAYHAAIAEKINREPALLDRARRTLARQRALHPHARRLFDVWEIWLELPVPGLIGKLLATDLVARDMRQVSPFAGILSARRRLEVLRELRELRDEAGPLTGGRAAHEPRAV